MYCPLPQQNVSVMWNRGMSRYKHLFRGIARSNQPAVVQVSWYSTNNTERERGPNGRARGRLHHPLLAEQVLSPTQYKASRGGSKPARYPPVDTQGPCLRDELSAPGRGGCETAHFSSRVTHPWASPRAWHVTRAHLMLPCCDFILFIYLY